MEKKNSNKDKKNNNQKSNNSNNNISSKKEENENPAPNPLDYQNKKSQTMKNSLDLNSSFSTIDSANANNILDDQSINSLKISSNSGNEKLKTAPQKVNNHYLYNLEYFDEMYTNLFLDQNNLRYKLDFNYMNKQNDVNPRMRAILVDWLIETHFRFNFRPKTLYQTIYIIDLYLSKKIIQKENFQLLGATCLLISCKENEIFYPRVDDFVIISNGAYTKNELLKMENFVLKVLNFEIFAPTSEEFYNIISKTFNFNITQYLLGLYFLDSSLIDYNNLRYNFSTIAIACAYIVMKFYKMNGYKDLYSFKMISEDESEKNIKECARELCILVKNLSNSSLRSTINKYSSPQFGNVAALCDSK